MIRIGFLLCALGVLAACQTTAQVNDRLVQSFDDLVFFVAPDSHGHDVDQTYERLVRWDEEIHYIILGVDDEALSSQSEAALLKIAKIANVQVRKVKTVGDANFKIYIDNEKEFVINDNQLASCYTHAEASERGGIRKADIHLPFKMGRVAEKCVEHELLHGFGFRGHAHRIRSAMSYVAGQDEMSRWDRILLKALYHPTMPTAADRDDALAVARGLIPQLMETTD